MIQPWQLGRALPPSVCRSTSSASGEGRRCGLPCSLAICAPLIENRLVAAARLSPIVFVHRAVRFVGCETVDNLRTHAAPGKTAICLQPELVLNVPDHLLSRLPVRLRHSRTLPWHAVKVTALFHTHGGLAIDRAGVLLELEGFLRRTSDEAAENSRARREHFLKWVERFSRGFEWVCAPVLNALTRSRRRGVLRARGYEQWMCRTRWLNGGHAPALGIPDSRRFPGPITPPSLQ